MLDKQIHPMAQTFLNDVATIHAVGTVQSWFEEHEGELQRLPFPEQSLDLTIIEQTTLVSFVDCSEEQIPTSKAT
jgi:hypothetical protein